MVIEERTRGGRVESCSRNSGTPASSNEVSYPSRIAISITACSASTRRATNPSTAQLGSSSHWASSTRTRTGELAEASPINSSAASPIRNSSGALSFRHAEYSQQRIALTSRQPFGQSEHRSQKLMQTAKRKLCFRLHPDCGQHLDPVIRRLRGGRSKHGGLADSWLATHEQDVAAVPDSFDETRDLAELGLTPIQDTYRRVARSGLRGLQSTFVRSALILTKPTSRSRRYARAIMRPAK